MKIVNMKIVNWVFSFGCLSNSIPPILLQFSAISIFQTLLHSTHPHPTPPPYNSKFTQWVQDGLNMRESFTCTHLNEYFCCAKFFSILSCLKFTTLAMVCSYSSSLYYRSHSFHSVLYLCIF